MYSEPLIIYEINIVYKQPDVESYKGVEVIKTINNATSLNETKKFGTGRVEKDWKEALKYINYVNDADMIKYNSACDYFIYDSNGKYKWKISKGQEMIVRQN